MWLALALIAATFLTYANALQAGYVWDDHVVVLQNPDIRDLSRVGAILDSPDVLARSQPAPYYRPLHRLTYLVDFHLMGLDPRLSHLLNVGLHAGAVLALFGLGLLLFQATTPAFVAALLLAVHPINAEAVDFVTARNNLLVGILVLGAAISFLKAKPDRIGSRSLLAGALLLLALLSKETAFMLLPFLVAWKVLARFVSPDLERPRWLAFVPMVVATGIYAGLRARVLNGMVGTSVKVSGLVTALQDDLRILPEYLRLLVWPSGLTVHHGTPDTLPLQGSLLLLAWSAITVGVVGLVRQRRMATWFGLTWFVINFAPISGIVPIPSAPVAERFMYVPAFGIWLVVADQLEALRSRVARPRWVLAATMAACATLGAVTSRRNLDWRSDVSLFESASRVDPGSTEARYNLGIARLDSGDADGARREWERVVTLDARHTGALSQLGTWYAQRGQLAAAGSYFERVLEVDPRDVETRFNLAVLLERLGRKQEALRQYQMFLGLDPVDYPDLLPRVRERIRQLQPTASP